MFQTRLEYLLDTRGRVWEHAWLTFWKTTYWETDAGRLPCDFGKSMDDFRMTFEQSRGATLRRLSDHARFSNEYVGRRLTEFLLASLPRPSPRKKNIHIFFSLTGGHHHQICASICDRILEAESVLQSVTQLGEECTEHRIRNLRQSSQCRDRRCMFLSNRCHSSNDFLRVRLSFFLFFLLLTFGEAVPGAVSLIWPSWISAFVSAICASLFSCLSFRPLLSPSLPVA